MFIRNTIALLTGTLAFAAFQASPEAFFMPPAVVPATEIVTWPGDLKAMGADVTRLHDIEFEACETDEPVMLWFGALPGTDPGPMRLFSDGCEGTPDLKSLPEGVSEIRIEVTCQDGGGGYGLYAAYDGSATDDDGRLIPSSSVPNAYGECLDITWSPGFRVVFNFG